jgi:hypothetical protein
LRCAALAAFLSEDLEDLLAGNSLTSIELGESLLDLRIQSAALVEEAQAFSNDLLGRIIVTAVQLFSNDLLGVT